MAAWQIVPASSITDEHWHSWDTIARHAVSQHPLLSAKMARLLLDHFGQADLQFATLHAGGKIAGHAILAHHGHGRWRIFCPAQSPVAQIVVAQGAGSFPQVMQDLVRCLSKTAWELFMPLQDLPYSVVTLNPDPSVHLVAWGTTISARLDQGFDEYWDQRPKDLRSNIRRYMRRAEADGHKLELRTTDTSASLPAAVARYGQLESRGWKGSEGTALHPENEQGRFYGELLQAFCGDVGARVCELYFGATLVASRMLISGPTMHVMLKTTYDEEFKKLAPGRILLYLALQDLARSSASPVEFYTRANADMMSWGSESRQIHDVSIHRNALVSSGVRLVRGLRTGLRRGRADRMSTPPT